MDDGAVVDFCDSLYSRKPEWATGSLSKVGARFLASCLVSSGADRVVEIGTASGYSTALMASVLEHLQRLDEIGHWEVLSFDIADRFYVDETRKVGEAARELVPELLDHVSFNYFKTSADLSDVIDPDSIGFLFIDGSHKHPWPTLDLLFALPCLKAGATVVLDDINLPLILPEFQAWGAHYLFAALKVEKEEGPLIFPAQLPSMGSIRIPERKADLQSQLLALLDAYEWQIDVPAKVQRRVSDLAKGACPVRGEVLDGG